jgi:hypothetical protein
MNLANNNVWLIFYLFRTILTISQIFNRLVEEENNWKPCLFTPHINHFDPYICFEEITMLSRFDIVFEMCLWVKMCIVLSLRFFPDPRACNGFPLVV